MAGLKSLIFLRREHEDTSIALAGPSERVRQVIDLAGFLDFFAIYPSVQEALSALQVSENSNCDMKSGNLFWLQQPTMCRLVS